jgi:hypothetical protein
MNFRLEISNDMKVGLIARLQQAYQKSELRLVKRTHALRYWRMAILIGRDRRNTGNMGTNNTQLCKDLSTQRVGQPEVSSSSRTPRQIEQDPKEGVG